MERISIGAQIRSMAGVILIDAGQYDSGVDGIAAVGDGNRGTVLFLCVFHKKRKKARPLHYILTYLRMGYAWVCRGLFGCVARSLLEHVDPHTIDHLAQSFPFFGILLIISDYPLNSG